MNEITSLPNAILPGTPPLSEPAAAPHTMLDAAIAYTAFGFSVLPTHAALVLGDGSLACSCAAGLSCVSKGKHPAVSWTQFQQAPVSAAEISALFRDERHGVGIVTGMVSGIFVVDVDESPGKTGGDSLHLLQIRHDNLPTTVTAVTGGGGRHLLFRHPGDVRIKTGKNVLGPGIDVRGDGGFIVAPPSTHASGRNYAWADGLGPHQSEIAVPPSWLLELLRDDTKATAAGPSSSANLQDVVRDIDGRVIDSREGFMLSMISATIIHLIEQHRRLATIDEVFADAWPVYSAKVTTKAAGETLDQEGRGESLMRQKIAYQLKACETGAWVEGRAALDAIVRAAGPSLAVLSRSRGAPPNLPVALFGPFWKVWITREAEAANAPVDYVALPLLAAASAAIGNARWAQAWGGWSEPPVLWCASVGDPSSGKTAGAGPVWRKLLAVSEKHLSKDFAQTQRAWTEDVQRAKAARKKWEKDVAIAIEAEKDEPSMPLSAFEPPAPVRPRLRVADVTVEKLAVLLQQLPKGVLYTRDELTGWFENFSRYSNGSDRPFWLEAYVGGFHSVDRQKNPEPVRIPHLSVAVFGTIQPDRLAGVVSGADDGLTSRFLYAWPEPMPFRRPPGRATIPGGDDALLRLCQLEMIPDDYGALSPSYAALDEEGQVVLADFAGECQRRENLAHGPMKSALGKARGQALRLSLVLEYLWWCPQKDELEPAGISAAAIRAAVTLMNDYFLPMAERAMGDAAIPDDERAGRTLADYIVRERPEKVNVSAVRNGARLRGLRDTKRVKEGCRYLVEEGWLLEPAGHGTTGRPRGDYIVNPRLWAVLEMAEPA